ncbi:MAG: BlaI/MecI/CopY family transcriptional regulator [Flavobacteriales bacterium]|jgi:BlaI family transcriptional regulator, penicillinase repressor|nr:BlaI/MecI/CopY family transcriptional regulator [Flavobacteriales bacterium]
MEKLTFKEEEIIQVLWQLKKAFVKEVVAELPNPKPHYNTVSTVIRKMEEKGFVSHISFGGTHQYYSLISKEAYRKKFMSKTIHTYFDDSYKNVVSYLAQEEKISVAELKEIIQLIEKNK